MATVHDFAAARQAKQAQELRFPEIVIKRVPAKRMKLAEKRAQVRQAGKGWI